jgi:F-type H+-transporting ATPase subunit alpha
VAEQIAVLLATTEGVFDRLPLEKIGQVEKRVRRAIREQLPDLYDRIQSGETLDEDEQQALSTQVKRAIGPTYAAKDGEENEQDADA